MRRDTTVPEMHCCSGIQDGGLERKARENIKGLLIFCSCKENVEFNCATSSITFVFNGGRYPFLRIYFESQTTHVLMHFRYVLFDFLGCCTLRCLSLLQDQHTRVLQS